MLGLWLSGLFVPGRSATALREACSQLQRFAPCTRTSLQELPPLQSRRMPGCHRHPGDRQVLLGILGRMMTALSCSYN